MMVLAQDLRDAVLQAAMQGKLTEQLETDSSVEDAIKKAFGEKKELGIKKETKYPAIADKEIPYDIPESWKWTRLRYCVYNREQKKPVCQFSYIDIGSIDNIHQQLNESETIIEAKDAPSRARKIVKSGDVIYATVRPYLHNMCIIDREFSAEPIVSTGFAVMACHSCLLNKFLLYYLQSPAFDKYANATDNAKGVAYPSINDKKLYAGLIPIPPIEEQQRIVDRVNTLMTKINEYEKIEQKLNIIKVTFPSDMRNAILQAAMKGHLSERNKNDTLPHDLIINAKYFLAETLDGQRVKKKIIQEIDEADIPFKIPDTWEWVRLGTICIIARGGSPRPITDFLTTADDGINWIKIGDTEKDGKYILSTAEKIKPEGVAKSRFVHAGDFLLTNSMSYGRPYILKIDGCIHDGWLVISQPTPVFDQDYLYWLLSSYFAYNQFSGKVSGEVVKNLNSDKVANSIFPLPPIEEQRRIVKHLEKLMPLCEI